MIDVHEEPESIKKEFGGLMERCHFCRAPTRFWTADKHTPVCQTCAKSNEEPKKAVRND
jgi:hypothetical protein